MVRSPAHILYDFCMNIVRFIFRSSFPFIIIGNQIVSPEIQIENPVQFKKNKTQSATTLELSWTKTRHDAQQYNVYCYYPNCFYCSHLPRLDVVKTKNTSAIIRGLVPYTKYSCCVTQLFSNGESECSEAKAFSTLPGIRQT